MITQIRTFPLNLCASIRNFQTTKYSLEVPFQRNENIKKKTFFRKTLRSNLNLNNWSNNMEFKLNLFYRLWDLNTFQIGEIWDMHEHCIPQEVPCIITWFIVINIVPLTKLFCNCPLLKDFSLSTNCLLVWCN